MAQPAAAAALAAVYPVRESLLQRGNEQDRVNCEAAWDIMKNRDAGHYIIRAEQNKVAGLGMMTSKEVWEHFTQHPLVTRDQYCTFPAPTINRPWCSRRTDIMEDWKPLYAQLEPAVRKYEFLILGKEFMLPLGVDKLFPTEKSYIVLTGQASSFSMLSTLFLPNPNSVKHMQAFLIMKDVNPTDIPIEVQLMHEPAWTAHSVNWHLDNMKEYIKTGGDEILVRLHPGKLSVQFLQIHLSSELTVD
jgi:hypothetical protein